MKILIATDGSEYSDEAVKKVCDFVRIDEATALKVISVAEPVAPSAPFGVSDEYYIQVREALEKAAVTDVDNAFELVTECVAGRTASVEKATLSGKPAEAILEAADNWRADLIVVGSHGRGFFGRMLMGSVSSAIVKHAECSVLVVRKETGE
ncbi:MAG: universal stress protein [Pyrinomonadaceae bacterium]|nr:universal stress protein [Pyrinomonadaceae bacterium]